MKEPKTQDELVHYNEIQIQEILKHKWIESEKVGHDIGEVQAARDWIQKYADLFREEHMN